MRFICLDRKKSFFKEIVKKTDGWVIDLGDDS